MIDNPDHKNNPENPSGSPPKLVPPDISDPQQEHHSRAGQWLVIALGLLLVIAALVVLFLPSGQGVPPATRSEKPQPANLQPVPHQATSPPLLTNPEETARNAYRGLEQWLRKQAEAEAVNIAAWGGDPYDLAVTQAGTCEQQLGENQFSAAEEACTAAVDTLEQLMAAKQTLLADALRDGLLALENAESQTAAGLFQKALAIDTSNSMAAEGLRRARNLPEVLRLIEIGQLKEQAGETEAALKAFVAADSLDPDYLPARANLERVRNALADNQFNQALSRALQALSRGDLSSASVALKKAQSLKSNDPALRDLKQQLAQARQARTLAGLRQQSASLEKNEKWREALKACDQALALDSSAAFAINCRERVSQRIELDDRLQSILSHPERLFADAPLKEARQVLRFASQVTPSGQKLGAQIEQLTQLIRQAETEVEILLRSDGLTDVAVFHVGRLGRFVEKKLVLRTGNYTATGTRNGYRDVRQLLKVRPDSGRLIFTLRCEEPI
jgi:hypothetical protein